MASKRKLLRHTRQPLSTHAFILVCFHQLIMVKKRWENGSHQECKHPPGVRGQPPLERRADGKPPQQFPAICSTAPADGTSTQMPHGNWVSGTEPEHHWPIVRLICVLLRGSSPLCSARLHMQPQIWMSNGSQLASVHSRPPESLFSDKSGKTARMLVTH